MVYKEWLSVADLQEKTRETEVGVASVRERFACLLENSAIPPDDLFLRYRNLVGQIQFLTTEEEKALVDRARLGRQAAILKEKAGLNRLSGENLREMEKNGSEALDFLVVSYLPLVLSVARRFKGEQLPPILDLLQAGSAALWEEAKKDLEKDRLTGLKIKAKRVISRAMVEEVGHDKITTARKTNTRIGRILRMRNEFELREGREPSEEEISRELNLKKLVVTRALQALAVREPLSFEAQKETMEEEMEAMPDNPFEGELAEESFEEQSLARVTAEKSLGILAPETREIILMNFWQGRPQVEIGRRLGLSEYQAGERLRRGLQRMRELELTISER